MSEATKTRLPIERLAVSAYTVPTDSGESVGTVKWDSTTMILVEASSGKTGLGYTYGDVSTGKLSNRSTWAR